MIDRRRAISLIVSGAALAAIVPAKAQQAFQRYFPFFVDLPGWTGKKPDGLAMELPGNSMTTATREYNRGSARVAAQVVTGPAAQGALAVTKSGMKIETGDARMSTSAIDGMQVASTYNIASKSGAIIVALGPSAMFNLSFDGIADDEALTLAKKFDWKAIQAALPK